MQCSEAHALNRCVDSLITWQTVIEVVLQVIDKEVEHVKAKTDAVVKKARLAKTQEDVAGTLRSILKDADRKREISDRAFLFSSFSHMLLFFAGDSNLRQSMPELLKHISVVLKDELLHQSFLNEYCHILSDIVLPKPTYCQFLTAKILASLLRSFRAILSAPNAEKQ